MELRQLEAFVAVATELHFGRAAASLHLAQPTVSELVRRLERELGTPLLTRTTRRVALTSAGAELLVRSKVILEEVGAADAAVRRIAGGDGGTVRLGITPPVAPVLAPHLVTAFEVEAPHVTVEVRRMWLPDLLRAVAEGLVDVAVTCALVDEAPGVVGEVFCAEPLLVALRPSHRLAQRATVQLQDLRHEVHGSAPLSLFPAWALAQQQALEGVGVTPPSVALQDTDLAATRWSEQEGPDWITLVPSLVGRARQDVVLHLEPAIFVPYTLQWSPARAGNAAVARFVHCALAADTPPGWRTAPGHLRHTEPVPAVTVR